MPVFRLLLIQACCLFSSVAHALTDSGIQRAAAPSFADALNWTVSLLLVLAIFILCVWLLRKSGQFALPGKSQLGIVTALSLGMREKVVLVRVGNKQILLGVTPNRIDKLMELDGDDRLYQEANAHEHGEFAAKLRQVLKGRTDA